MGAIQRRRGPNVVGPFGLLQPFADGIKLIGKQFVLPTNASKILFSGGPLFSFAISLTMWSIVPFGGVEWGQFHFFDNQLSLLFLFLSGFLHPLTLPFLSNSLRGCKLGVLVQEFTVLVQPFTGDDK